MPFAFYERLTLALTLFISIGLIAFTGEVLPVFWGGAAAALGTGLWRRAKGLKPLLGAATLPTMVAMAFAAADLMYLAPNFLVATVDLVLLLLGIKALSAHRVADNLQMLGLSFLLVLASAVITADAMFGLLFLGYIFAGLSALVLQNLRGHWESAGGEPEVLGRRRGVLGRAFGIAVAALCVGILLFTLLVYFAFPRVGFRMWRADINLQSRVSGFSETVRLNDVGRIQSNPAIALRVEFLEGEIPKEASPIRKLRGVVLDAFDGYVWHDTQENVQPVSRRGRFRWQVRSAERTHVLRITPDPSYAAVLFAPRGVNSVRGRFTSVGISSTGDLVAEQGSWGRASYELELGEPGADLSEPIAAHYEVPENTTPRMRQLLQEWGEGLSGKPLAERLTLLLATRLEYTTDLADVSTPAPLDRFLFETRRGHCEFFAASLAVLLRMGGIPTRLVNGFNGGERWDEHSLVFRDLHAHSWVEAYFPGEGWIEFDPTPPTSPMLSWRQEVLRELADTVTRVRLFWGRWFVDYDFTAQKAIAKEFRASSDRIGKQFGSPENFRKLRERLLQSGWGAAAVLLGGVAGMIFLLLRWLKRARVSQNRLTRMYRRRLAAAERSLPRIRGQTPLQFATRLAREDRRWAAFGLYTELYYKLRYGQGSPDDALKFLELHNAIPKRD